MAGEKPLLVELHERISCSKGSTIEGFLQLLDAAYYAADVNHREFVQGVLKVTDPAVAIDLMDVKNRDGLVHVGFEIERLLQNYLDSVVSLDQRINELVTGSMPEMEEAWDKRRKEYKREPVNAFVIELRVYVHHSRQPGLTTIFNLWPRSDGGTDFSCMMCISRQGLEPARKWGKQAKRYMKSQPKDQIPLDQLVLAQFPLVEDLVQWVVSNIRQTYKAELDDLEALHKQYEVEYERSWGAP